MHSSGEVREIKADLTTSTSETAHVSLEYEVVLSHENAFHILEKTFIIADFSITLQSQIAQDSMFMFNKW